MIKPSDVRRIAAQFGLELEDQQAVTLAQFLELERRPPLGDSVVMRVELANVGPADDRRTVYGSQVIDRAVWEHSADRRNAIRRLGDHLVAGIIQTVERDDL